MSLVVQMTIDFCKCEYPKLVDIMITEYMGHVIDAKCRKCKKVHVKSNIHDNIDT